MNQDYLSIEIEPSVGTKGVPEILGQKHLKPILNKKVNFKKGILSELFDDNYLSLLAVNLIKRFPINSPVLYDTFRHDTQRWCIVKIGNEEWTSVDHKIYRS